ncbi:hypothetical protein J6590_035317 [Homalodisca vitripennis]|nr:hypothetical protein J6590_035317 [Homalodisca vitripennis]
MELYLGLKRACRVRKNRNTEPAFKSFVNGLSGALDGSQLAAGKEKLCVPASEPVRLVLESDGTQVEDGEYFRTLPNNTVILLLRQGERWYPTGVDVIRTGNKNIMQAVVGLRDYLCSTFPSFPRKSL